MAKKDTPKKKKTFEPTIKADDQVVFDVNNPEMFTEFEYLSTQVEVLKEVVQNLSDILRNNNITMTEIIVADSYDDEDVFKRLEVIDDE